MAGPMDNVPGVSSDKAVSVLAVSSCREDHACLGAIFSHSNWRISEAPNCRDAIGFLRNHRTAVVVCESVLPDGRWTSLLEILLSLPVPPMLIVTAKHADDSLWAEVLNLGAYDVLLKPFDRAEVTRVISLAWLHWKDEMARGLRKPGAQRAA